MSSPLARRLAEFFTPRTKADWMCTFSGVQYYPAAPRAEDVRINDIAHALSMLCRYTGHTRKFFSVAEHSILVSEVVPPELALAGLLHDATEAYINDLSRPLKRSLPDYKRIEALNWAVIADKFDLPIALPQEVHDADIAVCWTEAHALMPAESVSTWSLPGEPAHVHIMALPPDEAESLFLWRFHELTRGRGRTEPVRSFVTRAPLVSCEGCAA